MADVSALKKDNYFLLCIQLIRTLLAEVTVWLLIVTHKLMSNSEKLNGYDLKGFRTYFYISHLSPWV